MEILGTMHSITSVSRLGQPIFGGTKHINAYVKQSVCFREMKETHIRNSNSESPIFDETKYKIESSQVDARR